MATEDTKKTTSGETTEPAPPTFDSTRTDVENARESIKSGANTTGHAIDDVASAVSGYETLKGQIKAKTSAAAGQIGSSSIVGKAAQNIFEFPVFVSSSVPIAYATATNALLEQMYASYLQMAVSINPVVSEDEIKKGTLFSKYKTDTNRYLEFASEFYQKEACHNVIQFDDCVTEFNMVTVPDNEMKVIQEALAYEPLSEFDHYFQEAAQKSDKIKRLEAEVEKVRDELDDINAVMSTSQFHALSSADQRGTRMDRERLRRELQTAERTLAEAKRDEREDSKQSYQEKKDKRESDYKKKRDKEESEYKKQRDEARDKREQERDAYQKKRDEEEKAYRAERDAKTDEDRARRVVMDNLNKTKMLSDMKYAKERHAVDMKVKAPQMLDETKIQKLNSMKPLMMSVGVKVMNRAGNVSDMIDYVVGVKTHCRVVKASVLPDVVAYPSEASNLLSRRAKWRAGEIKFLDYLFNRDAKKQAAYDSQSVDRRWYHRLYTLAHSKGSSSVVKKISGKGAKGGLIPNVTIIMSKADVDMIEATKGIDLMKGSVAANFCKELFLMALVVIDTDSESVKILLPDIHKDYDVHSIASINKQLATLDTSNTVSQEVNKLMRGR